VITASLDKSAAIWSVPMASDIPPWLPELAEAVGGLRLNAGRVPEPVSWAEYAELKARLSRLPDTESLAELARRCFHE
jgi:hypothetical protein